MERFMRHRTPEEFLDEGERKEHRRERRRVHRAAGKTSRRWECPQRSFCREGREVGAPISLFRRRSMTLGACILAHWL